MPVYFSDAPMHVTKVFDSHRKTLKIEKCLTKTTPKSFRRIISVECYHNEEMRGEKMALLYVFSCNLFRDSTVCHLLSRDVKM